MEYVSHGVLVLSLDESKSAQWGPITEQGCRECQLTRINLTILVECDRPQCRYGNELIELVEHEAILTIGNEISDRQFKD